MAIGLVWRVRKRPRLVLQQLPQDTNCLIMPQFPQVTHLGATTSLPVPPYPPRVVSEDGGYLPFAPMVYSRGLGLNFLRASAGQDARNRSSTCRGLVSKARESTPQALRISCGGGIQFGQVLAFKAKQELCPLPVNRQVRGAKHRPGCNGQLGRLISDRVEKLKRRNSVGLATLGLLAPTDKPDARVQFSPHLPV